MLVAGASLGLAPLPGHRGGDTRLWPEPCWGRLRCAGAVSARGRRRLAHDCDFAASLMNRLRGSRLLSLPAAPPWPAACLLTPARSTQPHTGTRTHSLGHTPATHTCPRDRAHRTGHAPTRRLGQAGPLAPSCACAHTGVHVFSSTRAHTPACPQTASHFSLLSRARGWLHCTSRKPPRVRGRPPVRPGARLSRCQLPSRSDCPVGSWPGHGPALLIMVSLPRMMEKLDCAHQKFLAAAAFLLRVPEKCRSRREWGASAPPAAALVGRPSCGTGLQVEGMG